MTLILNGLLRQYALKQLYPKHISQVESQCNMELVNHRFRKTLDFSTPHELFWIQE
jgi:IS30 family transposase